MKVSPSVISSKLEVLGDEINRCVRGGAFSFHLDVMDGHFVPNMTMGPDFIKAVRRCTDIPLEAHLMVDDPRKFEKSFISAGASVLLIHVESPINTGSYLSELKEREVDFGVVINPETSFEEAIPFLQDADTLVIMSVHPGFSGQKFIHEVVPKVRTARRYITEHGLSTKLEVDGGVNAETAVICREAGADMVVSASYVFSGDVEERVRQLSLL